MLTVNALVTNVRKLVMLKKEFMEYTTIHDEEDPKEKPGQKPYIKGALFNLYDAMDAAEARAKAEKAETKALKDEVTACDVLAQQSSQYGQRGLGSLANVGTTVGPRIVGKCWYLVPLLDPGSLANVG